MKKVFIVVFAVLAMTIFLGTLTLPRNERNDEIAQCLTWALGSDWQSVETRDVPARWNERHGDLFKLHIDDDLRESNNRIYEAWRKQ